MAYVSECAQIEILYYDYILPVISGLAAISMIPGIFLYIKAWIKGELETIKTLFIIGTTHFMVTFCALISYTIQHASDMILECHTCIKTK